MPDLEPVAKALDGRDMKRRSLLKGGATTGLAALTGCIGGRASNESDEYSDVENGTKDMEKINPNLHFEEVYQQTFDGDASVLQDRAINELEQINSLPEKLEQLSITLNREIGYATTLKQSNQFLQDTRTAIHNDLNINTDQVRILGRAVAGQELKYNAIFRKNQNNNWKKDLNVIGRDKQAYLKHGQKPDPNHSTSQNLNRIWGEQSSPVVSALNYHALQEGHEDVNLEEAKERHIEDARRNVSRGNDLVVVAEEYMENQVEYTPEAAELLSEVANWHQNNHFNREMEIVEQATETFHNSEEPYLELKLENNEIKPVPVTELDGLGQTYPIFAEAET